MGSYDWWKDIDLVGISAIISAVVGALGLAWKIYTSCTAKPEQPATNSVTAKNRSITVNVNNN